MAVNKKVKSIYTAIFDGIETRVANIIMIFQVRRDLHRYVKHMPRLTSIQKKAVREFWKPYCRISTDWARYYTCITGKFEPGYIPNDLQYTKIDQYYNARKLGYGFNDKNYYSLLFPDIKQPTTVVRKIGGLLFDAAYRQIDIVQARTLLLLRTEVIVKPSQESGSGRNIRFLNTHTEYDKLEQILLDKEENNLIIQDIVKQHHELAKMHPQSLNTVRIYTIMLDDGVHVLSASLKMGANDSRIDNVSANSGIITGIKENGQLMEFAYFDMCSGKKTDKHPQGMMLRDIKVPSYDKMIEKVKQIAQCIGNFRLVGWDLSVDEEGDVVLIEANMRKGAIGPIQCLHGPFYGEWTKQVLNEVFRRKNK